MRRVYVDAKPDGTVGLYDDTTDEFFTVEYYCNTHNEAEYQAIIFALEFFLDEDLEILSDSQLVINQLNGTYQITSDRLYHLAQHVKRLSSNRTVRFVWISRERNKAGRLLRR